MAASDANPILTILFQTRIVEKKRSGFLTKKRRFSAATFSFRANISILILFEMTKAISVEEKKALAVRAKSNII